MRYSRMRSAYLGIEPQRRNRKNADKSRVTKKKKDDKSNKKGGARSSRDEEEEEEDSSTNANVKPDPNPEPSPRIKQEGFSHRFGIADPRPQTPTPNRARPPAGMGYQSVSVADMHSGGHLRMLTPCSDSDLLGANSQGVGFASSPAGGPDMLHSAESPYNFSASPCAHEQSSAWHLPHPSFSNFGGYDLDNYQVGYSCDHHLSSADGTVAPADVMTAGLASHHAHGLGQADTLNESSAIVMVPEGGDITVKHEEWNAQQYEQE